MPRKPLQRHRKATPPDGPARFPRPQAERITAHARLDRQIAQLTRLNRISNGLLVQAEAEGRLDAFAEAIPAVLDMAIGVVWEVLGSRVIQLAACGIEADEGPWCQVGSELLARIKPSQPSPAMRLERGSIPNSPLDSLCEVLFCPCVNLDGDCVGLTLAANPRPLVGLAEPASADTLAVLTEIGERFASVLSTLRLRQLQFSQHQKLEESEARLRHVLSSTSDGWWDWDLRRGTCLLSSRWREMLGGSGEESLLQPDFWLDRVHPGQRQGFAHSLRQVLDGQADAKLELELELRRDDGAFLPVLMRGRATRGEDGRAIRFSGTILDLSERRRQEALVQRLVLFDRLTDLPNRIGLGDHLCRLICATQAAGQRLAVLLIGLDGFKTLNEIHGHAAGDQLLRQVALRLRRSVRPNDLVARLGGDEFAVVLAELDAAQEGAERSARQLSQTLLEQLSLPYELPNGLSHHTACIGVALLGAPSASAEELIRHADMALHQAKRGGRALLRLFEPGMQRALTERSLLEGKLRAAFEQNELDLHYQGIVDLESRLCGAEALMRWPGPGAAGMATERIIAAAEDSGLIHQLGEWRLQRVGALLRRWQGDLPDDFRLSLNLSATRLQRPDFEDSLLERLERLSIDSRRLKFEITESAVLDHRGEAGRRMHRLRATGLEFALDDFGTGHASISYLRELPFSEVKLDKSFVHNFLHNRHDAAILRAVRNLCQSLEISLVAEGVETEEQWRQLRNEGINRFQGFLFSRPQPAGARPECLLQERWRRHGA